MRLLLITTVYPTPQEPTKGPFNQALVRALVEAGHEVAVVAPVPWTVTFGFGIPASAGAGSESVTPSDRAAFPTYYFTPKVLRTWYGWFLWLSIRGDRAEAAARLPTRCRAGLLGSPGR